MTTSMQVKKKVCLLGSFGVGKTSLIRRFVYDVFEDQYLSTIGVKVSQKLLPPIEKSDGTLMQYNLMLWDIEGQEKFNAYSKNYYLGSAGAVLVLDVTRRESWTIIPEIIERFSALNPQAALLLACNKSDIVGDNHPSLQAAADFAADLGLDCLFTSAKTGRNVQQFFERLAKQLNT